MYDYLKGQLIQITEELNNLVYDLDRQYYNELILRHRTITNVIYMSREYKDVVTLKALLADKIRMEQILQKGYNIRYSNNDITYDEYLELTYQSNIVTGIYSEVIEFIESHK